MKKFFIGGSRISLIVRIAAVSISGLAAITFLGGTSVLFARPAVTPSNPFCNNVGSSLQGIVDVQAVCNGLANSLIGHTNTSLKNSASPGQLQVHPKNSKSGATSNFIPNSSSNSSSGSSSNSKDASTLSPSHCPTPNANSGSTSNPSTQGTQGGQNGDQSGQNSQSGSDTATQAAQAVFNQINAARAQAGLPALQWSTQLVNSAHNHNLAMQSANQMSHQLPNEPAPGTRISQAGVHWSSAGENIGESSDYLHPTNAATGLDQGMLNEQPPNDGHRQNILSKDFTIVGIDVVIDTTNHKVWLTEDFAHPA